MTRVHLIERGCSHAMPVTCILIVRRDGGREVVR
jgi:hypothetical protein